MEYGPDFLLASLQTVSTSSASTPRPAAKRSRKQRTHWCSGLFFGVEEVEPFFLPATGCGRAVRPGLRLEQCPGGRSVNAGFGRRLLLCSCKIHLLL